MLRLRGMQPLTTLTTLSNAMARKALTMSFSDDQNWNQPSSSRGKRKNFSFGKGRPRFPHARKDRMHNYENEDGQETGTSSMPSTSNDAKKSIRPPPGLKGKEIGLFYRNLSLAKKKVEGNVNNYSKDDPQIMSLNVKLDEQKEGEIRDLVCSLKHHIMSSNEGSAKYENMEESNFKKRYLQNIQGSIETKIENSQLNLKSNPDLDEQYFEEIERKKKGDYKYNQMVQFRKSLPTNNKHQDILHMIEKHQVLLISGETGCGKTTQVAQFILDNEIANMRGSQCRIVCTQPRRISAISVAERVADERAENIGHSVGYQIRLEHRFPRPTGSITFCTTGILIQIMQSDPALSKISHLILDEIHERDILCDFTLTLLKDILPKRPTLKVILMSATLNSGRFSKYFYNCPTLNIPGFTYPVKEYYLEDVLEMTGYTPQIKNSSHTRKFSRKTSVDSYNELMNPYIRNLESDHKYSRRVINILRNPESEELDLNLIANLIHHICTKEKEMDGAILVFLPGWTDISELNSTLTKNPFFNKDRFIIFPLHSLMPTVSQKTVFKKPPSGVRKIILSTQIAETSVTIDDVEFVINCGKIKINNYDVEQNISTLKPDWVSLANSRQRRGRAGRTRPGICYHLYNRHRENLLEQYLLPEILRKRLDEVIMTGKLLQVGKIGPFLNKVMDPPDPRAVESSLELLKTMEILDDKEDLTPLGYHLAKLPLSPQTAKMILMGALFSCIDPVFSVAASLSFKDPFFVPLNLEKEVDKRKRELADNSKSDHLLLIDVLSYWENASSMTDAKRFANDYFLSHSTLNSLSQMKKQFAQYLYDMKFLPNDNPKDLDSNINSHNTALVKAIISSGLYPNVAYLHWAKVMKSGVKSKITTKEDGRVHLHPKSINFLTPSYESPLLLYHQKLKSSKIFLHDTTMVYPLQILFFGSPIQFTENANDSTKGILSIGQFQFACRTTTALVIMDLKKCMDWLLQNKIKNPGHINWNLNTEEITILRTIDQLISSEDSPDLIPRNYKEKNEDAGKVSDDGSD